MKLTSEEQKQILIYLHEHERISEAQMAKLSSKVPFANYDVFTDALERLCHVPRSSIVTLVVEKFHIPAAHDLLDKHRSKTFDLPELQLPLELDGVAMRNRAERMIIDELLEESDPQVQYSKAKERIAQTPNNGVLRYFLAWLDANAGNLDEGLAWVSDVTAGPADNPAIVALRAWFHYQKRQYMQSFRPLRKLISAKPDSAWEWHILLAVAALQIDDEKTALFQLKRLSKDQNPFQQRAQAMLEAIK